MVLIIDKSNHYILIYTIYFIFFSWLVFTIQVSSGKINFSYTSQRSPFFFKTLNSFKSFFDNTPFIQTLLKSFKTCIKK
jgi:hypothetical protein